MTEAAPSLVGTEWLAEHLTSPDVVVLDGSFFLPAQGRDAQAEYGQIHLPGARFFDIDRIADPASDLPHMLPSADRFAAAVGAMGIGNDTHVIVYDSNYFMASARVWWTFRVFGHDLVSVLDGGVERWRMQGREVDAEPVLPEPRSFTASYRPDLVCDLARMRELAGGGGVQVVDARSAGRFRGSEPEPRAGIRGGHIPGSLNLPHRSLADEESRCFKPDHELARVFEEAGVDGSAAVVTSCGTGVTAAILALGLHRLGNRGVAVYDGSWTEWGGRDDTPVVTG
ncbi:MAG: 3-mercaptopyruvate sulfurtransferase [Methylococcaceae bacterium]|nr:3-mercaptopyruvate sulfurtransferase [Methylococcaceae bacterium]